MSGAFDALVKLLEQRLSRQEASLAETKAQLESAKAAAAIAAKRP